MMNDARRDRLMGCFLGLAVGDCVGAPLEFRVRDTYEHLTDMIGGGPFDLPPGYWTDDTSMAICLAESILARGGIDAEDLRARWLRWMQSGENSSTGRCFDVGVGTRRALLTGTPGGEGNGSLMRLAPVVLRYGLVDRGVLKAARDQSDVTHGPTARACAGQLAVTLKALIVGFSVDYIPSSARVVHDASPVSRDQISSSGYCIDTLRAALWCLRSTTDFRSAVLLAANLGDDADTVAAVTGQLAGAKYGLSGVPREWLDRLHERDRLTALGEALIEAGEEASR